MTGNDMWRFMTLAAAVAVSGCGVVGIGDDDDDANEIEAVGVVEFIAVEGGCWSIRSRDDVYEPLDLPEDMKIDGLVVEFEGEIRIDVASICQIGPIIDLKEIETISGS